MAIAVVVPTYNEKENISRLLSEILVTVPGVDVFVVDDNSPDQTAGLVKDMMGKFANLHLLNREKKEGLGRAYIYAFNEILKDSKFTTIIMMDADFSHNPGYLPKLIELGQKYDLAIGSRYIKGGKTIGWEMWRKALSYGGNLYCRLILSTPIHDVTSGFLAIKADCLKKIDLSALNLSGYAFTIGLKYALIRQGFSFKELPIVFQNRTGGESKISNHIIREGIIAPWKMIFKK
ncbi:MAG: polyprenol monophosphomannose synthase [Patescibacteria group bacterium]|jgi:dolichol-phosphate mannosyltransferase